MIIKEIVIVVPKMFYTNACFYEKLSVNLNWSLERDTLRIFNLSTVHSKL